MNKKEYIAFMNNPENIRNCSNCPERLTRACQSEALLPCGQQHCWVDLTVTDRDADDEDEDDEID